MPCATTDNSKVERFPLKSLTEAWVELRYLNYGEKLERQAMATNASIKAQTGRQAKGQDVEMTLKTAQRVVAEFEFKNCIVDHNLEDASGTKLDFRSPLTIQMLHPRVGDEISRLIGDMNDFDEELGNSNSGSGQT